MNAREERTDGDPDAVRRRQLLKTAGLATTAAVLAGCTDASGVDGDAAGRDGTIRVEPADALVDVDLEIVLSEFDPNQAVTVWAQVDDGAGQTWLSYGEFETDEEGAVAVGEQAPRVGTYDGVDPMGLVWSMRVAENLRSPFIEDERYTIRFTAQVDGDLVDSAAVRRRSIHPDVSVTPVDDDPVGLFFEPPGPGPHPGVLALHGSEGEAAVVQGAMLASRGFATLALQYFSPDGEGGLPQTLDRIPLEYGERALEWLLERDSVGGQQAGVVGWSKGGELALLLGSTFPTVGCVVGYVPSGVVFQGLGDEGSSWTYRGDEVPYVPFSFSGRTVRAAIDAIRGRPAALESTYRVPLEEPGSERVREAEIPVEEIDGPVLLISGGDDDVWSSTPLSEISIDRLDAHDHPYPYEHLAYENAGHLVSIPHHPTSHYQGVPFVPGVTMSAGGTAAADAHAASDSWPTALEFLQEGLE